MITITTPIITIITIMKPTEYKTDELEQSTDDER